MGSRVASLRCFIVKNEKDRTYCMFDVILDLPVRNRIFGGAERARAPYN